MKKVGSPAEIYGELFEAVQSKHVFADSKTFVDATPLRDAADIVEAFARVDSDDIDAIRAFVEKNFRLPADRHGDADTASADIPVRQRIDRLWEILSRAADRVEPGSSLIALPRPYIVPGGRFREVYYWDSYFTMLGLAEAGRYDVIEDMVENFAYLIDEIGFIPNGNRTYFCTRSQPPVFVLMVRLLADVRQDPGIPIRYLPQMQREYDFWMRGAERLDGDGSAHARVVRVGDGILNRYWDDDDGPRPESYAEDRVHAANAARPPAELYREIRAACESGWDFSSRWFCDPQQFETIRTTAVVPVDLNSMMLLLETELADGYAETGDAERERLYRQRAGMRLSCLQERFYDDETGIFQDLLLPDLDRSRIATIATAFPLFAGAATDAQAAAIAERIRAQFLAAGGWRTTLTATQQQWDRPNGWAPLQWVVYQGLRNYGFDDEAREGAGRWVQSNLVVYESTGRLLEKYDVEHLGTLATGGEYVVQDGFGWTNAVLLKFLNQLGL